MGVYLGDDPVDGVYLGDDPVDGVYLGDELVWPPAGGGTELTGGTVVDVDGYRYHRFTVSGTLGVITPGPVEYVVVGGGGGGVPGNARRGGGGAAGAVIAGTLDVDAELTVLVGAGGTAQAPGSDSALGAVTANGGNGSGTYGTPPAYSGNGSNSGGTSNTQDVWMNDPPAPGGAYGNAGGRGMRTAYQHGGGGGGGGAGTPGGDGPPAGTVAPGRLGGDGGDGVVWLDGNYYGGGGGGTGSDGGGAGGLGGGGRGETAQNNDDLAGTPGTGGGGGGALGALSGDPSGGSGIVIVRYPHTAAAARRVAGPGRVFEAVLDDVDVVDGVYVSPYAGWIEDTFGPIIRVYVPGSRVEVAGGDELADDAGGRAATGPGGHYDDGLVERFVAEEWSNDLATIPDEGGNYYYDDEGHLVWHDGYAWRNLLPDGSPNVWEPGVANWRNYPTDPNGVSIWIQPTGAYDAYPLDYVVAHNGAYWQSNVPANVWEPGAAGITQWNEVGP